MAQKTLLEKEVEQKDFETLIAQAKDIVAKLNTNDISLKDSLSLFKEGTQILKQAQDMLESAKLEFEEITKGIKSYKIVAITQGGVQNGNRSTAY